MSYRSIKRVLGETNLERKCRVFFGICLLLLISVAFVLVDRTVERLVMETTRSKGQDLVNIALLKLHFPATDTRKTFGQLMKMTDNELKEKDYTIAVLTPSGQSNRNFINAIGPADPRESEILLKLQKQYEQRQQAESNRVDEGPQDAQQVKPVSYTLLSDDHRLVDTTERKLYQYYVPVRWQTSCTLCHKEPSESGALSAAEGGEIYDAQQPFHALRVSFPYDDTQQAINQSRAILAATGIATFSISMLGLYVIVRYVIVKPLKHMRDVSDDISRGKTELRAELNTGDEFEELANSFNRMVRHLTDTQAELRHVNEDLDAKVDELAQLNLRLHEMNQLKSEFLANMSHELRTPLNSIIGFSEVLQGIESLNGKQKRYATNIQQSGRVLLEMINDILDLAKMEAGKMEVRPTEFDIAPVVRAHCDMVRTLSEDKNIDLDVHLDDGLPPLFHDQAKVQRILTNLLSNAIKFTPEGGRITVSVSRDAEQRFELIVADTGVGIAEEDRDIIFEKFRQGPALQGDDNLTREYSGTGLGLSIVKELCKLLGGEVSLESQLGKGSRFKVVLPWTCTQRSGRQSELESKLSNLNSPGRDEFQGGPLAQQQPLGAVDTPSP